MKTIWKYGLVITGVQNVPMPNGAEILTVQIQGRDPQLWALVDTESPQKGRVIETYGTGHEIPEGNRVYIGTYQLDGFVFHVFEQTANP